MYTSTTSSSASTRDSSSRASTSRQSSTPYTLRLPGEMKRTPRNGPVSRRGVAIPLCGLVGSAGRRLARSSFRHCSIERFACRPAVACFGFGSAGRSRYVYGPGRRGVLRAACAAGDDAAADSGALVVSALLVGADASCGAGDADGDEGGGSGVAPAGLEASGARGTGPGSRAQPMSRSAMAARAASRANETRLGAGYHPRLLLANLRAAYHRERRRIPLGRWHRDEADALGGDRERARVGDEAARGRADDGK